MDETPYRHPLQSRKVASPVGTFSAKLFSSTSLPGSWKFIGCFCISTPRCLGFSKHSKVLKSSTTHNRFNTTLCVRLSFKCHTHTPCFAHDCHSTECSVFHCVVLNKVIRSFCMFGIGCFSWSLSWFHCLQWSRNFNSFCHFSLVLEDHSSSGMENARPLHSNHHWCSTLVVLNHFLI